jgi:hypothetical protein
LLDLLPTPASWFPVREASSVDAADKPLEALCVGLFAGGVAEVVLCEVAVQVLAAHVMMSAVQ